MKPFAAILILLAACSRQTDHVVKRSRTQVTKAEIQTIDTTEVRPAIMQPPPMLPDEAPAPKPLNLAPNQEAPVLTPDDEHVRAQLPFAPAIGLDPVDGQKLSIRATTPMVEYKNHIFYFNSEANKRTFMATPEQFTKGPFAHL